MVGIDHQVDLRARSHLHRHAGLKTRNPLHDRRQGALAQNRRGHLRQLPVSLQEAIEGSGSSFDDGQPALKILTLLDSQRDLGDARNQAACDGLDGRERIVEFVPQDPDESLPGTALFFPQGPADIGQNDQGMRHTFLAEGAAAHQPARIRTAELQRNQSFALGRQARAKPNLSRGAPEQPHRGHLQQALSGGVDQTQNLVGIEGEQGYFDLLDDAAQQGGGFDGLNPPFRQQVGQGIDFQSKLAQRIVRGRAAGAE